MRELLFSIVKKKDYKDLVVSRKAKTIKIDNGKQNEKLLSLLLHAKKNSVYYQKVLPEISPDVQLKDIPILTKELIAKHKNKILSSSLNDIPFSVKNSTSGSSGKASYFYSDLRDGRAARAYRGDEFVPDYKFLDKQLIFWGAERDIVQSFSFKKLIHRFLYQTEIISTYHLKEDDIKDYVIYINRYRPKTIVGYPSALYFMAKTIVDRALKLEHQAMGVITSGEMLYPHQRKLIEEVFKVKVFNRYGCREFGHIANECMAHNGYHYNADSLIIEVVDDQGEACQPGEEGQLLVTDLNNYAFPMIRYLIGDRGSLSQTQDYCECGVKLPKLSSISGRSFDVIHGINGNRVSGTFWTLNLRGSVKGIDAFQIRQESDYSISFFLKVNEQYSDLQENTLKSLVGEKLGGNRLTINIVDEFDYSPTGKFKWIHSELNR